MIDRVFTLAFNIAAMAAGMGGHVTNADVTALMTDARVATPIIKRRICADRAGWTLGPGSGGSDTLRDAQGVTWQVKSISPRVTTRFVPSSHVGKGRHVDAAGVVANWNAIGGYLLADIAGFPDVRVYVVPAARVREWAADGRLRDFAASRTTLLTKLLPDVAAAP